MSTMKMKKTDAIVNSSLGSSTLVELPLLQVSSRLAWMITEGCTLVIFFSASCVLVTAATVEVTSKEINYHYEFTTMFA